MKIETSISDGDFWSLEYETPEKLKRVLPYILPGARMEIREDRDWHGEVWAVWEIFFGEDKCSLYSPHRGKWFGFPKVSCPLTEQELKTLCA